MKTVCEPNKCAGCMACLDVCPNGAIQIEDNLAYYNAIIQEDICVNCGACQRICQSTHPAEAVSPIAWYQGWMEDLNLRKKCSSGGFATAIATAFIENGGIVCSCTYLKGKFQFVFAEKVEELKQFIGSKYVKSNPLGIYKAIKEKLRNNKNILFLGLPCQVSALKNFVGVKLNQTLYTVDLICHGTPSPKLLENFLNQYGQNLTNMKDIQFRVKAKFQIYGDYKSLITRGVSDRYSIAFLNSLTYTENCYSCSYAKLERVSDVTLGDSWGSELSIDDQKNGISLALCQTEKGIKLLEQSHLHLEPVDLKIAVDRNHQLKQPSAAPAYRKKFFEQLAKGKKFNSLVFRCFPKACLRQNVKELLIKAGVFGANNAD